MRTGAWQRDADLLAPKGCFGATRKGPAILQRPEESLLKERDGNDGQDADDDRPGGDAARRHVFEVS